MLEEDCLRLTREEAVGRQAALATTEHPQRGQMVRNKKNCRSGINRTLNFLRGKVLRGKAVQRGPKTIP